jgi:ribonuclease HI
MQIRWWNWHCDYLASGGASFEFAFPIKLVSTNNQAEYESILKGLQLINEVKVDAVEIFGDSQLVINQLIGLYECKDDTLKFIIIIVRKYLIAFLLFQSSIFLDVKTRKQIG